MILARIQSARSEKSNLAGTSFGNKPHILPAGLIIHDHLDAMWMEIVVSATPAIVHDQIVRHRMQRYVSDPPINVRSLIKIELKNEISMVGDHPHVARRIHNDCVEILNGSQNRIAREIVSHNLARGDVQVSETARPAFRPGDRYLPACVSMHKPHAWSVVAVEVEEYAVRIVPTVIDA